MRSESAATSAATKARQGMQRPEEKAALSACLYLIYHPCRRPIGNSRFAYILGVRVARRAWFLARTSFQTSPSERGRSMQYCDYQNIIELSLGGFGTERVNLIIARSIREGTAVGQRWILTVMTGRLEGASRAKIRRIRRWMNSLGLNEPGTRATFQGCEHNRCTRMSILLYQTFDVLNFLEIPSCPMTTALGDPVARHVRTTTPYLKPVIGMRLFTTDLSHSP